MTTNYSCSFQEKGHLVSNLLLLNEVRRVFFCLWKYQISLFFLFPKQSKALESDTWTVKYAKLLGLTWQTNGHTELDSPYTRTENCSDTINSWWIVQSNPYFMYFIWIKPSVKIVNYYLLRFVNKNIRRGHTPVSKGTANIVSVQPIFFPYSQYFLLKVQPIF